MELVAVDSVSHDYGTTRALDSVSVGLAGDQVVCLAGPNAAGKTTLLRIMALLLRPTAGAVRVNGHDSTDRTSSVIGYVADHPFLYDYLSGWEHLAFFSELRGKPCDIEAAIRDVGLEDHADALAGTYSLGLRRRLALAIALMHDPPVLLMDEPFNGLDPEAIELLLVIIRKHADRGGLALIATHLLPVVQPVTDRLLILDRGRLCADIPTANEDNLLETYRGFAGSDWPEVDSP